jgi:hypothetical protein
MLVGTEDAIEYLKYKTHIEGTQVFGVTLNENLIYLEAHPATSTVYEELIHSAQFRTGKYNEWVERYGNRIAVDMMEKEAAEKLIANASAWKIPAEEVEMIKKRLKIFSKNLKKIGL